MPYPRCRKQARSHSKLPRRHALYASSLSSDGKLEASSHIEKQEPALRLQRNAASFPASSGKVFAQRPARIRRPETAAALQLWHEKIDDVVEHINLLGLGMTQHEAAAASRALEALPEIIGDRGRGAGARGGVAGRDPQAMLHELFERNLAVI